MFLVCDGFSEGSVPGLNKKHEFVGSRSLSHTQTHTILHLAALIGNNKVCEITAYEVLGILLPKILKCSENKPVRKTEAYRIIIIKCTVQ